MAQFIYFLVALSSYSIFFKVWRFVTNFLFRQYISVIICGTPGLNLITYEYIYQFWSIYEYNFIYIWIHWSPYSNMLSITSRHVEPYQFRYMHSSLLLTCHTLTSVHRERVTGADFPYRYFVTDRWAYNITKYGSHKICVKKFLITMKIDRPFLLRFRGTCQILIWFMSWSHVFRRCPICSGSRV